MISEEIDKRTSGYKRREEDLLSKPNLTAQLVRQALNQVIEADYLLMDSWFTEEPLIKDIKHQGLDVIGMIKRTPKRFCDFKGKRYNLMNLLSKCNITHRTPNILESIQVKMIKGIPIKFVFIRHRNKSSKWLAILSMDTILSNEEIISIYGYRWSIETFFKCNKSYLKFTKEFQCHPYDSLIAHKTIIFTRYTYLAREKRKTEDSKSLGKLFFMNTGRT